MQNLMEECRNDPNLKCGGQSGEGGREDSPDDVRT